MTKKSPNKVIYYITNVILDTHLAPTIHIDEVCTNFIRLGYHTILYAPAYKKLKKSNLYQIKYVATVRLMLSLFYQINLFIRLYFDVFKHKPHMIYVRYDVFLFTPVLIGRIFKIPIILEINGIPLEELHRTDRNFLTRILFAFGVFNLIELSNIKSATGIIAVTSGIEKHFVEKYKINPQKITSISNGVNLSLMSPMSMIGSRSKLGLDKNAIYVGYVGSLFPWQGLRFIAESALLVCAKRPKVKFMIIGEGYEASYLHDFIRRNGLEQKIEIKSSISHDLVPSYINAMDICLSYPDKFRNNVTSPFKIYEYLSCAKPVVSADIAGMREEFGNLLFYAEPESPGSLASTLTLLIDNKSKRKQLGVLGRTFVEQGHSWEMVTKQILQYCQKLI